jgi:antitoxin component YwqK of YwqJK toxin-antitoxin module
MKRTFDIKFNEEILEEVIKVLGDIKLQQEMLKYTSASEFKTMYLKIENNLEGNGQYKIYRNEQHKFHNENGPAVIRYDENGNPKTEVYYINGLKHRTDGPAEIWYNYNMSGEIATERYYIDGIRIKDEFKIFIINNGGK